VGWRVVCYLLPLHGEHRRRAGKLKRARTLGVMTARCCAMPRRSRRCPPLLPLPAFTAFHSLLGFFRGGRNQPRGRTARKPAKKINSLKNEFANVMPTKFRVLPGCCSDSLHVTSLGSSDSRHPTCYIITLLFPFVSLSPRTIRHPIVSLSR